MLVVDHEAIPSPRFGSKPGLEEVPEASTGTIVSRELGLSAWDLEECGFPDFLPDLALAHGPAVL